MPKILFKVSEEQKELWVEAAFSERLTLSEWIRRQCDGALAAGDKPDEGKRTPDAEVSASQGARSSSVNSDTSSRPAPAASSPRTQACPHRVPAGSYCKRCD